MWVCDPSYIDNTNLFVGRFSCTHPGISVEKGLTKSYTATVNLKYDFSMKAGKQVYVGDYETMSSLFSNGQDPMDYFGVSRDQISSWQSESPVGLGLGLLGEDSQIIVANKKGEYELWHYLGVTITNLGSGELLGIDEDEFKLILPDSIEAASSSDQDMDFEKVSEENLDGLRLIVYKPKKMENLNLKPGEYKTFYFKFRVWDDEFLKDAQLSSFFVLANLKFDYADQQAVSVTVKGTQ